eukprot:m.140272 g.140272  ORF g.140272 m.140272 type:complete len:660 (+) comp17079_c0_seq4:237-2216(+)
MVSVGCGLCSVAVIVFVTAVVCLCLQSSVVVMVAGGVFLLAVACLPAYVCLPTTTTARARHTTNHPHAPLAVFTAEILFQRVENDCTQNANTLVLFVHGGNVKLLCPEAQEQETLPWNLPPLAISIHGSTVASLFLCSSQIEFGREPVLAKLYGASYVVADLTNWKQSSSLLYQLGVRESFGRSEIIVTMNDRWAARWLSVNTKYSVLLYQFRDGLMQLLPFGDDDDVVPDAPAELSVQFRHLIESLKVNELSFRQAKFLEDMRAVCDSLPDPALQKKALNKLEAELTKDVSLVTAEIVYRLALAYRDVQDYDRVVRICDRYLRHPHITACEDEAAGDGSELQQRPRVALLAQQASALTRRNKAGDRERALKIMLDDVVTSQTPVPDNICLVGKIYKDLYMSTTVESERQHYIDEAIKYYQRGFDLQQSYYPAINLATLRVIRGESVATSNSLAELWLFLTRLLGSYGAVSGIKTYWTVATVFEMHVLFEHYQNALQDAYCMFQLRPPTWYLTSTMSNIRMILDLRRGDAQSLSTAPGADSIMAVFDFWWDMFEKKCLVGDAAEVTTSAPVLLREPLVNDLFGMQDSTEAVYQPCRLVINHEEERISLLNVCSGREAVMSCVGQALRPAAQTEWRFQAQDETQIQRAALHESDENCLYM